jgi:hypothetical protein
MKVCKRCLIEKEDVLFKKDRRVCFSCLSIQNKAYRDKNKDRLKKYRADHRDYMHEYNKGYKRDNKDKIKKYIKDNKIKVNKQNKENYERNKESILKCNRDHYNENKDKICNRRKEIYRNNPKRNLYRLAIRKSIECNREINITIDDIIIPKICPYLNITDFSPSIDRINNNLGYVKNNIIVVSTKSNMMKSNLSLEEIIKINENYDVIPNDEPVDYSIKKAVLNAKSRAKKNNMEFDITVTDIPKSKNCPLLGIPLIKGVKKITENSPTIDRIDNTKGYVRGNVRIISAKANRSKNNSTKEEYNILTKNLARINKLIQSLN